MAADSNQGPIVRTDRFIKWLRFCVPGMVHPGQPHAWLHVVENLPSDKPILEIGSFCGLSTCIIAYYLEMRRRKNTIFTADKWIFEGVGDDVGTVGGSPMTWPEYREFVKQSYMRRPGVRGASPAPHH